VHALVRESKALFMSLQGLTTLVSQKRAKLSGLDDTYCRMTGMTGSLTNNQMSALEASETEVSGWIFSNTRQYSTLHGRTGPLGGAKYLLNGA
jgi:hypothetical protein